MSSEKSEKKSQTFSATTHNLFCLMRHQNAELFFFGTPYWTCLIKITKSSTTSDFFHPIFIMELPKTGVLILLTKFGMGLKNIVWRSEIQCFQALRSQESVSWKTNRISDVRVMTLRLTVGIITPPVPRLGGPSPDAPHPSSQSLQSSVVFPLRSCFLADLHPVTRCSPGSEHHADPEQDPNF